MPTTPHPQVVVVTGASGGVGRAIAHAFAKRGAHVGLLARGQHGLDDAAEEVRSLGGQALAVPTDVADPDQVEAAALRSKSASARSTSGSTTPWPPSSPASLDTEPDEFKRATEVTYLGAVYGTMAALRRMARATAARSCRSARRCPTARSRCRPRTAARSSPSAGFTDSIRTELLARPQQRAASRWSSSPA